MDLSDDEIPVCEMVGNGELSEYFPEAETARYLAQFQGLSIFFVFSFFAKNFSPSAANFCFL